MWMHETNTKSHAVVSNIQRQGARQLLGLAQLNDAICDPPQCVALLETQLKPAHVLRIMGLLRFWRIVLSRPKESILRRVWDVIDFHHSTSHPLSLNMEVRELQRRYPAELGSTVPHPMAGLIGQQSGSGFSDMPRPALGVFASLGRF
jgi:hypothetical protein